MSPHVGGGARGEAPEPPSQVSSPEGVGGDNPPPALDIKEEVAPEPDADPRQGAGVRAPSPSEGEDMPDQQPLDEPMEPPPAAPDEGGAGDANPQGPRPQVDQEPLFERDILRRAVQYQGSYDETARRGRR